MVCVWRVARGWCRGAGAVRGRDWCHSFLLPSSEGVKILTRRERGAGVGCRGDGVVKSLVNQI